MKNYEKNLARELRRKEGFSLKEISKKLGVSKSTVSLWVRDIILNEKQKNHLSHKGRFIGANKMKEIHKQKRTQYQEFGREESKNNNIIHAIGCALYWAEGAKDKNSIYFSNSDLHMMILFKKFLIECFNVQEKNMAITIQCYDDLHSIPKIENYWISNLKLPKECIRKTIINKISSYSRGKRCGKLEWGTCRISVYSTELVQRIYGAIQEYGKFKNNKWLM